MRNEDNYKEKIRKLLALAESPNEHEARAALLKARQLMAEHKLTEAELKDVEKQEVKDIRTDITCSKRRNPWIINLSAVIGENYCCKGYRKHGYGEQTQVIGFIGLEDDVELCATVFEYAVDCVISECKRIKKENACYYSDYVKRLCDSYGYGLSTAFRRVSKAAGGERAGVGACACDTKEVEEAAKDWGKQKFRSRSQDNISGEAYTRGFHNGKEFNPKKRLAEEAAL